jgi:glucose/arabinose dehydrogenase
VPDYLVRPQQGGFYGWPYAYIGQHPQPGFAGKAPDKVKASKVPDLLFESHSSAMDLVFYAANQFPALPGERLCGAQGIVESGAADRLQGGARAVPKWPTVGLL